MLREHDLVALTENRPEHDLRTGDVGAIVHCYGNADEFEVEFIDERGRTKCVATVPLAQMMKLNLLSLSA